MTRFFWKIQVARETRLQEASWVTSFFHWNLFSIKSCVSSKLRRHQKYGASGIHSGPTIAQFCLIRHDLKYTVCDKANRDISHVHTGACKLNARDTFFPSQIGFSWLLNSKNTMYKYIFNGVPPLIGASTDTDVYTSREPGSELVF